MHGMTLITGASGHIGGNLVRSLLREGRPVRALIHRQNQALEGLDVECVRGDICNPEHLIRATQGIDVVYHCAAHISIQPEDFPRLSLVNANGTSNVVEACLKNRVRRLIHFSSIHAFSPMPLDAVVDENRPLLDECSRMTYDISKAESERIVRKGMERGLDAVILSPTGVIGPYDYYPSLMGTLLLAMARKQFPVRMEEGFNWVDVRDVADAAVTAEKRAASGSKYILSGHWKKQGDIARIIEPLIGVPAPALAVPLWLVRGVEPLIRIHARITGQRPLATSYSLMTLTQFRYISGEKAVLELGYNPRPFKDTISDTIQWFLERGILELEHPPLLEPI